MIIQCHECGTQVSTEARACMRCGAPPKFVRDSNQTKDQEENFVTFEEAEYEANCPTCGELFLVTSKSLAKKTFFNCPHPHAVGQSQKIKIGEVKPRLANGKVIYRRLKDYYSFAGRISVGDYWLSALIAAPFLVIAKIATGPLYPILFFAILLPLFAKRLHDHGLCSEWAIIQGGAAIASFIAALLIPEVLAGRETYPIFAICYVLILLCSIGFGITIAFIPGKNKINRYGPPTSEVKSVW
jgi:uncharacterized membrane protein YhaH (DUF805 family)